MLLDLKEVEVFSQLIDRKGKKWTVEALTNDEVKEYCKFQEKEKDTFEHIKKLVRMTVYRKFLGFKIKFPVKKLKKDELVLLDEKLYEFVIGKNFMKKAKEAENKQD